MIKSPKHQLQATCAGAHPEDHDAASPSRVRYSWYSQRRGSPPDLHTFGPPAAPERL